MRIHCINDIHYPRRKPTPMPPFTGCNSKVFGNVPILPIAMATCGGALAMCLLFEYLVKQTRKVGK